MQINGFSNPFGSLIANTAARLNEPLQQSAQTVNTSSPVSIQGDAGRRISSAAEPSGAEPSANFSRDQQQLEAEQRIIRELAARDREVRQHEMAHQMAGGQYTGGATYTFERGPDGVMYAVGGQVSVDTSSVPGDPEATLQKAQTVERAALAPADPSPQDLKVAASARAMANEARAELLREQQENLRTDDVSAIDAVDEVVDESTVIEQEQSDRAAAERQAEQDAAELDQAEEARQSRRATLAEEQQERRERSAEAMREFARDLADIQAQLRELNKRLVETGALQGRNVIGRLLDREA